ncbi:class I SAM-dependent methyltransferase [Sphingosinicella sp. LHD-64]|uniref:class I SAM-dependent methyltransferase n=1 Tax=Sphingosinicella sp. LHD-64 TaxID=3072139 RepID=UPI00280CE148|nr:class I SAM-dependent methyltransferase [Sphingosinicella sp. LHD-64]MDQ8756289.1 class I SAM-dependent methyltransferase [Sphingosinicella sp. LHD-64]
MKQVKPEQGPERKSENTAPSALFRHVEHLHAGRDWGAFLDAGTGVNSSLWGMSLPTSRWCAVTGSRAHAAQVRKVVGDRLRPQDRLIVGNWLDPELLTDERFDTVLADYLVGAIEGFSPYFQSQLFRRLRPLCRGMLYVIGLDPYVVGPARTPAERMVREVGRLRDACLILADETPYREYPLEWAVNALTDAGFRITSARRFANRYREKWVHGQLDMGLRRLAKVTDRALATALEDRIGETRTHGVALCRAEGGLACGSDYVVACEIVP